MGSITFESIVVFGSWWLLIIPSQCRRKIGEQFSSFLFCFTVFIQCDNLYIFLKALQLVKSNCCTSSDEYFDKLWVGHHLCDTGERCWRYIAGLFQFSLAWKPITSIEWEIISSFLHQYPNGEVFCRRWRRKILIHCDICFHGEMYVHIILQKKVFFEALFTVQLLPR